MNPAFTFAGPVPTEALPGEHPNPGPLERPMKTTLEITEQCNLDCRLCYGRCKDAKPRAELSIDQWRGVIDDLARSGVIWLYIEGGEPFLKEVSSICWRRTRRACSRWSAPTEPSSMAHWPPASRQSTSASSSSTCGGPPQRRTTP